MDEVATGPDRIGTAAAVRAVTVAGTAGGATTGGGVGTPPVSANFGFLAAAAMADADGRTGPMMSLPPPPFATGAVTGLRAGG
ncbi:MAG: hypothetical protein EOP37_04600 [Rubrivivax sp.]|nr:MAG: hypothetical protein EOP37_04600 [Rubrivivax sp.]